jgi:hypothetical protein
MFNHCADNAVRDSFEIRNCSESRSTLGCEIAPIAARVRSSRIGCKTFTSGWGKGRIAVGGRAELIDHLIPYRQTNKRRRDGQ